MKIKERLRKVGKTRMAIYLALLVATFFFSIDHFKFNQTLENKMIDMSYQWRGETGVGADEQIIILAIDDQSIETIKYRWPWPRSVHAKVVDRLSMAQARVVAFDLIFSEASEKEWEKQDKQFGDAITRSRAWIVLASIFDSTTTDTYKKTSYQAAMDKVDQTKAHVGFVNIWPDDDSTVRKARLFGTMEKKEVVSFGMKILSRYFKVGDEQPKQVNHIVHSGPMRIPVVGIGNMLINFRGGQGNFKSISFENVYHDFDEETGEPIFPGLLDAEVFKDKIVLIGPTFLESQDTHPTPFGIVTGVEVHANILDTILNENFIMPVSAWMRFLIFLVLTLGIALITVALKPLRSSFVLLGMGIGYIFLALWIFTHHNLIVPMANPLFSLVFGFLTMMIYLFMTEQRHGQVIKDMFSRYVSPKVVEQLVKDPNAELKLGGNKQVVTVLFSDIRSFTTMSEELPAEAIVEQLNEYFQTWTEIIFKHDGMVDKFIGDAVMAIFGAPVVHPDDPIRAVRATLEMKDALERLNHRWQAQGKREFRIGVGINTGEAIVGNMGSHQAMGYTVIGDTVNLASRLEGKTKDIKAFLAISGSTYQAVKDLVEVEEFKDITVKGKSKSMSVYAVLGLKGQ